MKNFYYLHFKEDDGGVVKVCEEGGNYDGELQSDNIQSPFQFVLPEGVLQDYQANDLGWPLMSAALQQVLAQAAIANGVVWNEALIKAGEEICVYYVPRFLVRPNVLNETFSKIVRGPIGDIVVKACLAASKVQEYDFFPIPGSDIRLIVSGPIKYRIESLKLSGVDFSTVPVS
jgi:hypothetical protein